jgi:hypothetical protein
MLLILEQQWQGWRSEFHNGIHGTSKHVLYCVRFEVFTAMTMNNAIFWDVTPCRSYVNRCFEGTYRLHLQRRKIRERGTRVSRSSKRRFTQDLHGTTSQKTAFFVFLTAHLFMTHKKSRILFRKKRCHLVIYNNNCIIVKKKLELRKTNIWDLIKSTNKFSNRS